MIKSDLTRLDDQIRSNQNPDHTSCFQVLAMLMGEFDFTANFINANDTPFIAKIFFLIFILIMALVFMNLLLGLAVSDIGELERISKVDQRVYG